MLLFDFTVYSLSKPRVQLYRVWPLDCEQSVSGHIVGGSRRFCLCCMYRDSHVTVLSHMYTQSDKIRIVRTDTGGRAVRRVVIKELAFTNDPWRSSV